MWALFLIYMVNGQPTIQKIETFRHERNCTDVMKELQEMLNKTGFNSAFQCWDVGHK